ncbi:MAG: hypothetical protein AVDCRST_MAG02-1262 [uncultured Rubrobacteraceae bacterium]|uniref:Uncharacterized protein n=1 Tax=uncultured Rubrobacteraceae bacterium TaxID=349277 RepID=A0A6J4QXM3_9ACTN|nr:MAG: hypothetical protein AVDCRST_MAG02-1262 [uncultured Rubrobacteraceae bacterium]
MGAVSGGSGRPAEPEEEADVMPSMGRTGSALDNAWCRSRSFRL